MCGLDRLDQRLPGITMCGLDKLDQRVPGIAPHGLDRLDQRVESRHLGSSRLVAPGLDRPDRLRPRHDPLTVADGLGPTRTPGRASD